MLRLAARKSDNALTFKEPQKYLGRNMCHTCTAKVDNEKSNHVAVHVKGTTCAAASHNTLYRLNFRASFQSEKNRGRGQCDDKREKYKINCKCF